MQLRRMGSIVPRVECQLQHSITVTWPFAYQMIQRQRHGAIFAASSRKLRIFAFYGASCTTPRPSTTPTSIRPTRIRNKTKIAARKQCDSNWKKNQRLIANWLLAPGTHRLIWWWNIPLARMPLTLTLNYTNLTCAISLILCMIYERMYNSNMSVV